MRFNLIISLISILVFSGCAYEGTLVRKEFRPLPFSESLGLEGIYHFELRDSAGQIHSQMVTPQVFANYEVGDYFNDLQLPADVRPAQPSPLMMPFPRRRPLEYYETPYRPLRTTSLEKTAPARHDRFDHPIQLGAVKAVSHRSADKGNNVSKTHHRKAHKAKVAKKKRAKHAVKTAKTKKHKKTHTKVVRSHRAHHRDPA